MKLQKIISGGQTGVDQAALQVAIDLNLLHGGWCPPGRVCEDGEIDVRFKLQETPNERSKNAPDVPRSLRTEWNVRDSDATLIIASNTINDAGSLFTIACCTKLEKKFLIINPIGEGCLLVAQEWLRKTKPQIINVAGPSEKTLPGIYNKSYNLLYSLLNQ